MSLYCATGGIEADLSPRQLHELLAESLAKLGERKRVVAVPPDQSRLHSRAGELTRFAWEYYGDRLKAILPALGTHTPMQPAQMPQIRVPITAKDLRPRTSPREPDTSEPTMAPTPAP